MKSYVNHIFVRLRRWLGIVDNKVLFDYTNLLAAANRDFSKSVERNEFHIKVLDFLNSFIGTNGRFSLYHHHRDKGIQWHSGGNDQLVQILATGQIQKLSDSNTIYRFDKRFDMLDDLRDILSKPIHGGVVFQLFGRYDYIIMNHGMQHQGQATFQFISSMVAELKNRVNIQESYSKLRNKMDDLDKRLVIKENELRQSEKALKKRVYEIHNLLEISNELYSILNLKRLINSALLIILGQVGCQRAFAILYDSVDRKYSKKFLKGIETKEFDDYTINVDDPLIKHFTYNQRPVLVDELHGEKGMETMANFMKEHNIDVIAPIYNSERVRGILGCGEQLYNQSFDQSENDIFNILVNIISISVFNAQTFEEIRDLALTDAMTNLHNYRYFEDRLKEEINRARRSGSCVSIIMLDIDYFKNYNDTLGHQAGDEALRTLGLILKNTVREEDIVNRYGGEEFCIILPGLGKEVISILGERIREKVAEFPFLKQNVQPEGKLTVSLGGSTFPEDADDFEGLVYKADQALYKSKNSGRNRLTIYNYTN